MAVTDLDLESVLCPICHKLLVETYSKHLACMNLAHGRLRKCTARMRRLLYVVNFPLAERVGRRPVIYTIEGRDGARYRPVHGTIAWVVLARVKMKTGWELRKYVLKETGP